MNSDSVYILNAESKGCGDVECEGKSSHFLVCGQKVEDYSYHLLNLEKQSKRR
jgi:hypothetical protein